MQSTNQVVSKFTMPVLLKCFLGTCGRLTMCVCVSERARETDNSSHLILKSPLHPPKEMFLTWHLYWMNTPDTPLSWHDYKTADPASVTSSQPFAMASVRVMGEDKRGAGMWHSLHAPLAMAGMPEEVFESELI